MPVGPFRGGKHDVWEGGFRVPYLVRWPGHVPAGTVCDETVSIVDTLASLSAIVDAELPPVTRGAEDSFDVSKAWLGQEYQSPLRPDVIVHSADGNFAIRKDGWKWIEGIPADDVKPAARKSRVDQMTRMLFQVKDDIVESKDVASDHESVETELEILLHRYRDGGYSRELPPAGAKPMKAPVAVLPPISNSQLLDVKSFRGANWKSRDDVMFGKADDKGSPLSGPVNIGDGVLEFQVLLGDANRHSLRIHTARNTHSFRIVISGSQIDVALNPAKGESPDKPTPLGKAKVKFARDEWQTMRLTFAGEELTIQCAGTELKARHPVFAERKAQVNFIAFAGEVGVKQVRISPQN